MVFGTRSFRHKDKRMVLAHMAKHTRRDNFSCGLCGKGSNWQSVIRVTFDYFHNLCNTPPCPIVVRKNKFPKSTAKIRIV